MSRVSEGGDRSFPQSQLQSMDDSSNDVVTDELKVPEKAWSVDDSS